MSPGGRLLPSPQGGGPWDQQRASKPALLLQAAPAPPGRRLALGGFLLLRFEMTSPHHEGETGPDLILKTHPSFIASARTCVCGAPANASRRLELNRD